jgi:PIN domain nuclease of toxin-antitoxin system
LGDKQLSRRARQAIEVSTNTVFVSPASYWELAIKISLGKYVLNEPYEEFVQHAILDNGFIVLQVEPKSTSLLISLPFHHKDPFDRLLAAQAIVESMPIVSGDVAFDPYGVTRIW